MMPALAPELDLCDLPHTDALALVRGGMPIYLGIDPVEYHGPHLSLHNDRHLSRGVVRELGARLHARHGWPIVWAGHMHAGVDPCPGPGSRPVSYPVLVDLVRESCHGLADLGALRVVLVTFHGAPLHNLAIETGVQWLRREGVAAVAPFHAVLARMLELEDAEVYADALAPVTDARDRAELAAALRTDFHAGFFETSLALHWAPQTVSPVHRALAPCPEVVPDAKLRTAAAVARRVGRMATARELEFAAHAFGWSALRPFPGYTSRPHLANAASGAIFARFIVDLYEGLLDDAWAGRATPGPILAWLGGAPRLLAGLRAAPHLGVGEVVAAPNAAPVEGLEKA